MDAAGPFEKLVPEYQTTEYHILRLFAESCCLHLQHAMEMEAQGSSETLVPAEMTATLYYAPWVPHISKVLMHLTSTNYCG